MTAVHAKLEKRNFCFKKKVKLIHKAKLDEYPVVGHSHIQK